MRDQNFFEGLFFIEFTRNELNNFSIAHTLKPGTYIKGERFRTQVFEQELPLALLRAWKGLLARQNLRDLMAALKISRDFVEKNKTKLSQKAYDRFQQIYRSMWQDQERLMLPIRVTDLDVVRRQDWAPPFVKHVDFSIQLTEDLEISGESLFSAVGFDSWKLGFHAFEIDVDGQSITVANNTHEKYVEVNSRSGFLGLGTRLSNQVSYGPHVLMDDEYEFAPYTWDVGSGLYLRIFRKRITMSTLILPSTAWAEEYFGRFY